MIQIRAIPQRYGANVYRSRTEARWAGFFNLTLTPYQYEPEGFQLGKAWYVPDFWLPHAEVYFEVKSKSPTTIELYKATELAKQTECPVIIAGGNPSPDVPLWIVDDTGVKTFCTLVQDHDDLGCWVAEFADGGGWAFPLRVGLKNCAAYGTQHETLAEAAALQFNMTPEMDEKKPRQEDLGSWQQVGGSLFRVLKAARDRMRENEGNS
jgi:hypothetical protein